MEITVVSNVLEAVSICIVASVQCSHFILDKSDQLLHVCVVFFFHLLTRCSFLHLLVLIRITMLCLCAKTEISSDQVQVAHAYSFMQ